MIVHASEVSCYGYQFKRGGVIPTNYIDDLILSNRVDNGNSNGHDKNLYYCLYHSAMYITMTYSKAKYIFLFCNYPFTIAAILNSLGT